MKQKTHSGTKKRIKVRKSGSVVVQKAAKNHLLSNKSSRQKSIQVMPVHKTRLKAVRRLMPGKVKLQGKVKKASATS